MMVIRLPLRLRAGLLPALLAATALLALPLESRAATTFNVTTTAMTLAADGDCSLTEALEAARTDATVNECVAGGGAPYTINLQSAATYAATVIGNTDATLGFSAFRIVNAVEINGNGSTIARAGAQQMRLFVLTTGSLTIRNATLSGGVAPAGASFTPLGGAALVGNSGVLNLEDVTLSGNSASSDGAAVMATSGATVNLNRVTASGNNAFSGFRIDFSSTLNVANSTLADTAVTTLLGITNTSVMSASASTFRFGGIFAPIESGSTVTIRDSIITAICQSPVGGATFTPVNVSGPVSCAAARAAPVLGTLANNGGPTQTHMPRLPNTSKDAAPACTYLSTGTNPLFANGAAIATDQRGFARDANCDVGAVESMTIAPATMPAGTFNTPYTTTTITQTGGAAPATFAVVSGVLPPGLVLGTGTGDISGTPTTAGNPTIVVEVTDANGIKSTMQYLITIARANQTITFGAQTPATQPFSAGTFALNPAASSSSGLPIAYTSGTPAVCSVNATTGAVTITTIGTCTIRANQAGNVNYNAATQVAQSVTITAVAPGAPTIGTATAGSGSASLAFTAPASNGGQPITLYTATCGAFSNTGAGSPIVVSGLTNGTPYTCTVTATNATGTGPASAPSNSVTPVSTGFTGPTATGSGIATVTFTGGGAGCTFAPVGVGAMQSAFFIPMTGHPKSPGVPGPEGIVFPHGLLDFVMTACTPGGPVTFTVTYPQALPANTQYWKYGPTPGNGAYHWYVLPAAIAGNTATFTIVDGGLGDDDLAANGTIIDQGGPGFGLPQVPTLSEWMLALLAMLMLGAALIPRNMARAASRRRFRS